MYRRSHKISPNSILAVDFFTTYMWYFLVHIKARFKKNIHTIFKLPLRALVTFINVEKTLIKKFGKNSFFVL
jgi:hypothetical protein